MNHCYRLVFNAANQVWQAVAEAAKSHSKSAAIVLLPIVLAGNAWADPAVNALPTGGNVVAGQSAISQTGNQLNILQTTQRSIINWNTYNIGANATVNYAQPNASAISLNRVLSADPSSIFGHLNANGQVWLINPNGVLFGQGAQVNVGGLLASTLNILDDDFLSGNYKFTGNGTGSVVNMGSIVANNGGYVAMLAPEVRNEGVISALEGASVLAAGDAITLDFNGNNLINVQVDSANINTLVENKNLIKVGGGQVIMSSKAADGLITSVINNSGRIEADSMVADGGVVRLTGAKLVTNSGTISAISSAGKGGVVHMLGDHVGVLGSGSINASGKTGGGTILVGGDYKGGNNQIQNASATFISQDSSIKADATDTGNGGKVIVWADDATRFYGNISAKGGVNGGNGGFVETSGKEYLEASGSVDASASMGFGGEWLLDPRNILINAAGPTGGGTGFPNFDATADNAVVDRGDIQTALNGGTSVTITTGTTGVQAGNIDVATSITKSAGGNASLTLTAAGDINFSTNGSDLTSTTGALNVTLNAATITTLRVVDLNGGTLTLNHSGVGTQGGGGGNIISGSTSVVKQGAGTFTMSRANTYTGATTISAGTLALNAAGTIALSSGVANNATFSIAAAKTIDSMTGAGATTLGGILTIGDASNTSSTYNGVASGAGGITKAGTGTLTLGGANTYTGATTVSAGTLSAAHANALGATGTGTTVGGGATLNVNNVSLAAENITIAGNGVGAAGALTGTDAAVVAGNVNNNISSSIGTTSAVSSLTINGTFTSSVGTALQIVGAGDVTATNAANDFDIIRVTGARNVSLRDANNMRFSATPSTLTGTLTAQAANNMTLQAGGTITSSGGDIVLASTNFINNAGASALSASGRWLVYANAHNVGNTFGGLLSNNQAIWNTAYPTAVSQTGNRYVFANNPGTLTVTSTNQTKTYGQNGAPIVANAYNVTGTFVNAATFGNVFTQDTTANTVTGSATSTGSPVTANVGSYAIDVTPVTATTGYTLTKVNAGNLTVTPASLSITGGTTSNLYSAVAQTNTFTTSGLLNTDTVTGVTGLGTGTNVGTYLDNLSAAVGTGLGNYTISYVNGSLAITPAALTVTGNTTSNLYTAAAQTNSFASTGLLGADTVTGVTGLGTGTNVGTYLDNLSAAVGTGLGNYTISYVNGSLAITPAALTVTGNTTSNLYTAAAQTNSFASTGLLGADTVTGVTGLGTGTNVGTYLDNLSAATGTGLGNYTISYVNGSLAITPAALTVTGNTTSNLYSAAAQTNIFSTTGLLGADTVTGVTGLGTGTNVGTYADTLSAATGTGLGNYTISYVNGSLAITPAALTVTGNTTSNIYSAAAQSNSFGTTGLLGADTVTGVTGLGTGTNVGTYADTLSAATGTGLGNYTISYVNGSLAITPAALTVTGNTTSNIYTAAAQTNSFGSTGLLGADTVTGVTGLGTGTNVGTYADTLSAATGTGLGNYTISYVNGSLAITPAALVVAANDATKVQGSVNPPFSSVISGFVGGETSAVLIGALGHSTPATVSSPAGNYAITPFGLSAANYTISFVDGILNVTPLITPPTTPPTPTPLGATNVSALNGSLTRPERALQTCVGFGKNDSMISGLGEYGVDDIEYKESVSQPLVGNAVANALVQTQCLKL